MSALASLPRARHAALAYLVAPLLLCLPLAAQPSSTATSTALIVNKSTGAITGPVSAATFASANSLGGGGGGGSGTVTSFSAGDLSPLFTTTEANATTTPALSFSLSNAAQNAVFAGPATGGTGAPAYRALVAADIPSLTLSKISDAGQLTTWKDVTPSANGQSFVAAADYAAMRGLLSLGDAATKNTGTTAGTVAAGNDSRITGAAQSSALVAVNPSGVNNGGLVDWSQLMNVPAGFADGSDDGAGGGSGTVTSFSAGDLSPLFTTTEANPTSTPALSFSLSSAAQNAVFAGPATGGTGAPAYRALVAADIPSLPLSKISDAGDAAGKSTGTTAGTVAAGDDSRFTDTRTPTDGSVTTTKVAGSTLVTAAEGIGSNNNDTTIPTSAAVKAYADSVGGGTGNVTKGATFAAGQLLYVTNATTGEITGIAGATYNSGNNTITFNGTVGANAVNPSAVSGATANGQFLIGNVTSGNFEKATISEGAGITLTPTAGGLTIAANATGTNTGDQVLFSNIVIPGSNNVVSTSTTGNFTLTGSGGIVITGNNSTKTVDIDGSGITGGSAATGDIKFILDSASVPSGWALTGANGIPAITSPDADAKAVIKMAGTVATPTFSPVAGAVPSGTTITISSATSGVTFMTTNNTTDPSRSVGTAGDTWVVSANQTIKSMGYKDGAYLIDSAVASAAYTIDPVPTLTGAEINGTALTLTYSEAVSRGGSYSNAHFDLDMSTTGSNIAVTYVGGDGTTTHTYTAASAAVSGETVDLDFSGAANSIEETGGYNQDLAAIVSAAVTNSTAGGGGGPTLVASLGEGAPSGGGSFTTSAINTTGANFIAVAKMWYGGTEPTLSDSNANSYTPTTQRTDGASTVRHVRWYFVHGGTVGAGHTFTLTGSGHYGVICVLAFSGIASSPLDQEASDTQTAWTTHPSGSLTPTQANTVSLTGLLADSGSGTVSAPATWTAGPGVSPVGGSHLAGHVAWKILTATTAVNPDWTSDTSYLYGVTSHINVKY